MPDILKYYRPYTRTRLGFGDLKFNPPVGLNEPVFKGTVQARYERPEFAIKPTTRSGLSLEKYNRPSAQEPVTLPEVVITPKGNTKTPSSTTNTSTKSAPAVTINKGDTVATIWTKVTGLPWKVAKEMGLTDGSYTNNIEILKGLKSGKITKESVYAQIANQSVSHASQIPEETIDLSGMNRTDDYEPVPEAAPVMESGTPYTRAMSYGGRTYGYDPIWDVYYG